ncbi:uncharacterized protein LOC127161286 [Labeo rohita]|uniref:uncharacterized protein LOC127161286 n=1 Tax=Labeo rohita TaxID=84645 RepID=UPI0021E225A9|nr:uncharacterized protein LOC127161286 [Labeo rohita]
MKLASINVPPRRRDAILGGRTIYIFQDGRDLEDYVEEFISICHLANCDDVCLMEGFWCGLDDDLRFVMPQGEPCWTLTQYINILLSAWGSELCLDEAEEDYDPIQSHHTDVSQHDPEPSQSPPRPAEYQPEPTDDGELQPAATSVPLLKGATEQLITMEPELHEPSDQVREPATMTMTVEGAVEKESAVDSTTHCTTAEGERNGVLGHCSKNDLPEYNSEDVNTGSVVISELSTGSNFPPTLPQFPQLNNHKVSAMPPMLPVSPSAHPQLTICAMGSPQACQSPSASWLEDPSSPPSASESWTPPRSSEPAAPPLLGV